MKVKFYFPRELNQEIQLVEMLQPPRVEDAVVFDSINGGEELYVRYVIWNMEDPEVPVSVSVVLRS
jgi:hypothetical protein